MALKNTEAGGAVKRTKTAAGETAKTAAAKTPAKTANTSSKPADTVAVAFAVSVPVGFERADIFICGDIAALGAWVPRAALALVPENGIYKRTISLPRGQRVEFKVVAGKDWDTVEKGVWWEEVQNHSFVADADKIVELHVYHFNTLI
jgi:hypothetical protein